MAKQIELKIFTKEDRRVVAGILVDNGYSVKAGKRKREGSTTYDYLLFAEESEEKKPDGKQRAQ